MRDRELFMKKFLPMVVGNVMEMFDFASFGALVDIIGEQFFPGEDKSLQLLEVLSVFGAAFVMRPFGGALMGWIGDTMGRRRALEISIGLMLLPSFLIGCLPTYAQAGVVSTVLLLVMRMVQGLAVGGEVVGSYVFTVEATGGENRGYWGACCKASGLLGNVLGLGVATLLRGVLSRQQMYSWGWRVPFLAGLLFGVVGVYLRRRLSELGDAEGEEYQQARSSGEVVINPVSEAVRLYWREILVVLLASSFWGVVFYTSFVWLIYFMTNADLIGGPSAPHAWFLFFALNVALVLAMPLAGLAADRLGARLGDADRGLRLTMQCALVIAFVVAAPAFVCISTRTAVGSVAGQFLLLVPAALFGGNLPAFIVTLFSPSLRYSGAGLGYNVSQSLFASTVGMIQTALVLSSTGKLTGSLSDWQLGAVASHPELTLRDSRVFPAYYVMGMAALSFAALTLGVDWIGRHALTRDKQVLPSQEQEGEGPAAVSPLGQGAQFTLDAVYSEQWPEDVLRSDQHKRRYSVEEELREEVTRFER